MARSRRRRDHAINLDSLTDIMANTVGIMVFLMIFAVLTARGSFVRKRFPMVEQASKKDRALALCVSNTVMPCSAEKLIDQVLSPLERLTYDNMPHVVRRVNGARAQDEYFEVTASVTMAEALFSRSITSVSVTLAPCPGGRRDTAASLDSQSCGFRQYLGGLDARRHWVLFLVDGTSLEVFAKARAIAGERGFDSGWEPEILQWPLHIQIYPSGEGGGGWTPGSQWKGGGFG